MRRAAFGLFFSAFFLPLTVGGQVVDPNSLTADPSSQGDPLQQNIQNAQKRLHLAVDGGNQGFDVPTGMVIPTSQGNIRIEIDGNGPKVASQPAPPAGPDYTPLYIVLTLVIFGASIYMRREQPQAAAATSLGESPFTIVRSIGEGGMGVVYEAIDRNLERRVAVKKLRDGGDSPEKLEGLIKEAKTVAALHHPNIVDIYSVVSQGGEAYIVFEFIEGKTVLELLNERERLTLAETRGILDPVCKALEFAHGHGIIHRDLKPANVMLTTLGQVKVMDFGIARHIQAQDLSSPSTGGDYQMTNHIIGTPLYLAPEAELGMIRPEGDIYALGVMTYRMLCGEYPFDPPVTAEKKLQRLYRRLSEKAPGLPAGIDALIDDALNPEPSKRIPSPRAFRERLAAL